MAILYDNEGNQITMSEVNANASDIADLKSRMTTAEGDITSLDGRLDTAEPKISTLETTSSGLVANKEILGAKNMIPLNLATIKALNTTGTWDDNEYTYNGITYTFNVDSKGNILGVTLNGTALNTYGIIVANDLALPQGDYILNGASSEGGYGSHVIELTKKPSGGTYAQVGLDSGEGVPFTALSTDNFRVYLYAYPHHGEYIDFNYYPMIRLASDNNPTFEPYAMGNQELTAKVLDLVTRVTALET